MARRSGVSHSGGADPPGRSCTRRQHPAKNLADALSNAWGDLSWDEIFAGKVDEGVTHAQNGMNIDEKTGNINDRSRIFHNTVKALQLNKKYDEEQTVIDQQIQWLLAHPAKTDHDREELATVYSYAAQVAGVRKQFVQVVQYRTHEVEVRTAMQNNNNALTNELAISYGNLARSELEADRPSDAVFHARRGYSLDNTQNWIRVNEGDGLLLSGHPDEARAVYLQIRDLPYGDRKLSTEIASDLTTLCKMGHGSPQMRSIAHDVGIDDSDLATCLDGASK